MKENFGAADIHLTVQEATAIDQALDAMELSAVYGGAKVIK